MKCPDCGKEMEEGVISSYIYGISWKKKSVSKSSISLTNGQVSLGLKGYRCPDLQACDGKVLIENKSPNPTASLFAPSF